MKRIFSAVMVLLMIISLLAGCNKAAQTDTSSAEEKPLSVVGDWEGELDLSKIVNDADPAMSLLFGDEPVYASVSVSFKEDGSLIATIDAKAAVAKMQETIAKTEKLGLDMTKLMVAKMRDKIKDEELNEAELEAAMTSLLERIKALDTETMTPQTHEGKYRYENGKLYYLEQEGVLSENDWIVCSLTEDTLTFTGIKTAEPLAEEIADKELSISLSKVTK